MKERHGAIATQAQEGGCCGERSCCGGTAAVAERIGYTGEDPAAVPEGANLGLGCGNPLALDAPLPEALRANEGTCCSCISGAIAREEYLAKLAAAGLQDARVISATDAAALLAGDCCGGGATESELSGVVTSISVTARK